MEAIRGQRRLPAMSINDHFIIKFVVQCLVLFLWKTWTYSTCWHLLIIKCLCHRSIRKSLFSRPNHVFIQTLEQTANLIFMCVGFLFTISSTYYVVLHVFNLIMRDCSGHVMLMSPLPGRCRPPWVTAGRLKEFATTSSFCSHRNKMQLKHISPLFN